ncbi:helix-turn-helix domain-containing protein [Brevibacillus agri]|uniref:helix-turn-helix domain-containing protein n=1 Tax=Brevibacillus agri TaxID=51101 RepID=UPI002E2353C9|nr:helix-turn-helix domain-containing protein [Brevibacillus agri]
MKEPMTRAVLIVSLVMLVGAWMIADATRSISAYADSATHNTAEIATALTSFDNRLNDLNQSVHSVEKQIMNADEVAVYLGLTDQVLSKLLEDKQLPAIQINGIYRFSKRAIDEWVYEKSKNKASYQNW